MRTLRVPCLLSLALLLTACGSGQPRKASGAAKRVRQQARTAASRSGRAPAPPRPPQALVTDEAENRLLVVDLPSGRIARAVPLPADPQDIAATGKGGVVAIVSSRAAKVTLLNRGTLRTLKIFGGFDRPHIVAISPDDQYAYVTDDARGTLTAIRLRDTKVTSAISIGAGAHHLAFSPNERQIWVALSEAARTIILISTAVRTPPPRSSPVVDAGHPRVIGHFTPGSLVHDLAFSPDGRRVWITSDAGSDVTVFDARNHHALFRVPVGAPPQHLALRGRYAYLTSGYGGTIEKVDAANGHVIRRTAAPYGSFELDVADGYVAAASLLRGTLAIYTPNLKLLAVVKLAPATREVAISRP